MHTDIDLRPFHHIAIQTSVEIVNSVTSSDLDRPTPCAGWTLGDLLTHMTAQHHGFAAAARGRGDDLAIWDPATVADDVQRDPAGTYAAAASGVVQAFEADGVLTASFVIPEFGPGAEVSGEQAIGFHFVDYVVHGWDVARAMNVPYDIAGDVVDAVLPIAFGVPDGDFRDSDDSPFARAVEPAEQATDLDRVLSHLGRSPAWRTG